MHNPSIETPIIDLLYGWSWEEEEARYNIQPPAFIPHWAVIFGVGPLLRGAMNSSDIEDYMRELSSW